MDDALIETLPAVQAVRDDMKTWEWMFGQTPEFTHTLEHEFSWGSVVSCLFQNFFVMRCVFICQLTGDNCLF